MKAKLTFTILLAICLLSQINSHSKNYQDENSNLRKEVDQEAGNIQPYQPRSYEKDYNEMSDREEREEDTPKPRNANYNQPPQQNGYGSPKRRTDYPGYNAGSNSYNQEDNFYPSPSEDPYRKHRSHKRCREGQIRFLGFCLKAEKWGAFMFIGAVLLFFILLALILWISIKSYKKCRKSKNAKRIINHQIQRQNQTSLHEREHLSNCECKCFTRTRVPEQTHEINQNYNHRHHSNEEINVNNNYNQMGMEMTSHFKPEVHYPNFASSSDDFNISYQRMPNNNRQYVVFKEENNLRQPLNK